jgi:hypothetical protein
MCKALVSTPSTTKKDKGKKKLLKNAMFLTGRRGQQLFSCLQGLT